MKREWWSVWQKTRILSDRSWGQREQERSLGGGTEWPRQDSRLWCGSHFGVLSWRLPLLWWWWVIDHQHRRVMGMHVHCVSSWSSFWREIENRGRVIWIKLIGFMKEVKVGEPNLYIWHEERRPRCGKKNFNQSQWGSFFFSFLFLIYIYYKK